MSPHPPRGDGSDLGEFLEWVRTPDLPEPEQPPCSLCGQRPARGPGLAHCAPCAAEARGSSIFNDLTPAELRALRSGHPTRETL